MNDLDIEGLVGGVLRGVLGSRGKRSHGTLRYLTGGGRSSFLNASTLLAVAGVAWGLWETAQQQSAVSATPAARPHGDPAAAAAGRPARAAAGAARHGARRDGDSAAAASNHPRPSPRPRCSLTCCAC